jgi:hypothetical protein
VDACCCLYCLSPSQVNQALHNNSQTEHISFTQVRRFQSEHPIHICASEREGFGHYLNEARAASALVISTDHPPMNELVTSGAEHLKSAVLRGWSNCALARGEEGFRGPFLGLTQGGGAFGGGGSHRLAPHSRGLGELWPRRRPGAVHGVGAGVYHVLLVAQCTRVEAAGDSLEAAGTGLPPC